MFTAEFEKTASFIGRAVKGVGGMMGKTVAGKNLVAKGEKMIQQSSLKKAKGMAGAEAERLKNRMSAWNESRRMRGLGAIKQTGKTVEQRGAAKALKNAKAPAKGATPKAGDGGGFFGFVRRNPVSSAAMAGGAGYMIGKPSADEGYQRQPMIQ